MDARAKAAGHAMHPVLMVFPLGLLSTSVIFDVLYFVTDDERYASASFFMIAAGVISGLIAGAAGFLDWTKIPKGTAPSGSAWCTGSATRSCSSCSP
jgi:uncharacterized membrane protein